jgi:hypothetical protein
MKPIAQAATSVIVSVVGSIVATWLLRRLIFLADQPGEENAAGRSGPVIVVMPFIMSANEFGNTTIFRRPVWLPRHLAAAIKHRK